MNNSDLVERLRSLVAQWREEADCYDDAGVRLIVNRDCVVVGHEKYRVRDAYLYCADELAAVRSECAAPALCPECNHPVSSHLTHGYCREPGNIKGTHCSCTLTDMEHRIRINAGQPAVAEARPHPAVPPQDELVSRQCFVQLHGDCYAAECACACHQAAAEARSHAERLQCQWCLVGSHKGCSGHMWWNDKSGRADKEVCECRCHKSLEAAPARPSSEQG